MWNRHFRSMKLAPIGLGAYFANLIGEFGPQLLGDYGRCMLVYYPLCIVYAVVFFPLYAFFADGKKGVKTMLKNIFKPAITAFATSSSCTALPANMEACEAIGVPSDIYNIVLPLSCTMHMDGSVLSSITKIAFLFGIFGVPYTGASTYALSILVAVLSAFVLSGAPGGDLPELLRRCHRFHDRHPFRGGQGLDGEKIQKTTLDPKTAEAVNSCGCEQTV